MLMRAAAKEYNWNLNYGGIALMWRGGCIIRSAFWAGSKKRSKESQAHELLLDKFFKGEIKKAQRSWRNVVATAAKKGISVRPSAGAGLLRCLPMRTVAGKSVASQRDYFGAHTYERLDKPRGQFFHTNWTGRGGRQHPEPTMRDRRLWLSITLIPSLFCVLQGHRKRRPILTRDFRSVGRRTLSGQMR